MYYQIEIIYRDDNQDECSYTSYVLSASLPLVLRDNISRGNIVKIINICNL